MMKMKEEHWSQREPHPINGYFFSLMKPRTSHVHECPIKSLNMSNFNKNVCFKNCKLNGFLFKPKDIMAHFGKVQRLAPSSCLKIPW